MTTSRPTADLARTFLKGLAMGAANVVPGVSGGTVAFIFGIFERLIQALARFDLTSLRLVGRREFRALAVRIDLAFLTALGAGILVAILSLARLLEWVLEVRPVLVWAFFFGLILASVYFVGLRVRRWGPGPGIALVLGAAIAAGVALLSPASENASVPYLLLCGVAAVVSMIIPGLSGSFVLLLMGNYELVMVRSVSALASLDLSALRVLIPVGIGGVIGLLVLSRLLNWIFRTHHDVAVGGLTGFVAGSLLLIWPWKTPQTTTFEAAGKVREMIVGYDWNLPAGNGETVIAMVLMVVGALLVWGLERAGRTSPQAESP